MSGNRNGSPKKIHGLKPTHFLDRRAGIDGCHILKVSRGCGESRSIHVAVRDGLRALVLGNGPNAEFARQTLVARGYRVAQRLTSTVALVVVDETVSPREPRLRRARANQIPIWTVDELLAWLSQAFDHGMATRETHRHARSVSTVGPRRRRARPTSTRTLVWTLLGVVGGVFVLCVILGALLAPPPSDPYRAGESEGDFIRYDEGAVTDIRDASTLTIATKAHDGLTVEVMGVDAPDTADTGSAECGGEEAVDVAERLLDGDRIRLYLVAETVTPTSAPADEEPLVANVLLENGKNFAVEAVKS